MKKRKKDLISIAKKIANIEEDFTSNYDSNVSYLLNISKDLSFEDMIFIDDYIKKNILTK